MTRYTVVWSQRALDQLAEVWLQAPNQAAVAAASHQIDQALRDDPASQGVAFYGDRLLVVPPLQVVYRISEDDRIVEIRDAW